MSWKIILKNYKPLAHGVEGAKQVDKTKNRKFDYVDPAKYAPKGRGEPLHPKFQTNFGTSRVDYQMKEPTKMGDTYKLPSLMNLSGASLTNPDGSQRTVSQVIEETKDDPMNSIMLHFLRDDGKNPDTMTIQEYEQWRLN